MMLCQTTDLYSGVALRPCQLKMDEGVSLSRLFGSTGIAKTAPPLPLTCLDPAFQLDLRIWTVLYNPSAVMDGIGGQ